MDTIDRIVKLPSHKKKYPDYLTLLSYIYFTTNDFSQIILYFGVKT